MKKSIMQTSATYKKPMIEAVEVVTERGFETSSQMDDMNESEGSWY